MESLFGIGANVTITGIVIVFSMLVVLVVLIALFGMLMKDRSAPKKKKKPAKQQVTKTEPIVKPLVPAKAQEVEVSAEIVAVIAAAVASMYEGSGKRGVVRNVRPAVSAGQRPIWAMAGLLENTKTF